MINAAERADERYDAALERLHGRQGVAEAGDDTWRRVNSVLNSAHQVKDKAELPEPSHGPRVHVSRTGFFRGSELTHRRVPKRDCAGRSRFRTRPEEPG